MQRDKTLAHGNIKVKILDDDLDVVSEKPSAAKDTTGFAMIWVVADVYVFKEKTNYKDVENQRDNFPKGITFEVPIPPAVLNDPWISNNSKNLLSLVYYDKNQKKWVKFKDQQVDLTNNKATVTLKKWIKDPPIGWGGDQPD